MKNKEIEELLNNIKEQLIIDEKLGKEIAQDFHKTILNYEETKLLLSYIEQLEEELKEEQEENYKQSQLLVEKQQKIEQLENNRDKAIEFIQEIISSTKGVLNDYGYNKEHNKHLIELLKEDVEIYKHILDILKGDSE